MSFQQKTLDLARRRVGELSTGFAGYVSAFESESLFTGPSLYFHHKTLAIRRELACSVEACLKSDSNFESLYATLASWGLHRMGPGKTKLVEFSEMVCSFRLQAENLKDLARINIHELSPEGLRHTTGLIWKLIWDLRVGVGSTKIVSGSKALHHLLPELVPPIDREYTVQFFLNNKNAIQGDETKQREAFWLMYPYFVAVCRDRRSK